MHKNLLDAGGGVIMVRCTKETRMNKESFAAPHEWMAFWKKAAEDHATRATALADEWAKLEGKSVEQAGAMVDEMAKLTKESLAYTSQLAAEWRKLTLDVLKSKSPAG
jgi:hypothetical protein